MLQFITHYTDKIGYVESARLALEGGCRWIQLRMKGASDEEFIEAGRQVRELCNKYGATFIIDDHVELVKTIGADGVHLGLKDMPINEARELLGTHYIIGGTANTYEQILMQVRRGADYIGCGPFRYTTTKDNLSPVLGIEGYKEIATKMKADGINIQIVAIGGITADDIPAIMETGMTGIALSGTILRANDPIEETRSIIRKIEEFKN